jgi:hypothetical protein
MYPPTTCKMPKPARTAIVHALRGRDGRQARELSVIAISKLLSCTRSKGSCRLIAPVDGIPSFQLPNSRIGCCPSASSDIAGSIHERYGRCRISSSVRGLTSKGPAPQMLAREISAETQSQPWLGDHRSRGSYTAFSEPRLIDSLSSTQAATIASCNSSPVTGLCRIR